MAVADDLQDLNNDIWGAYSAINGKGGTVPQNKNTNNLATAITSIPSGGGVTRPTTWAEFAAMSSSDMQKVYGVGDRVGIACSWVSPSNGTTYNLIWEITAFGTTKKENDNTEYPCVTLVARLGTPGTYVFDAAETPTAATEETAQDGIYYFGFDGTNYTALNLSAGDTIPYGDYTAVYKTDITNNASYYAVIKGNGYNVYKYSALRQWLNSDAAAGAWWQASHVGDIAPAYASTQAGFMNGLDSAFKAILQRTEVISAGNGKTDDGSLYSTYDYFFPPSYYEIYGGNSPAEGDRMSYFFNGNNLRSVAVRGSLSGATAFVWWQRTATTLNPYKTLVVSNDGTSSGSATTSTGEYVIPACKIILQS